MATVAEALAGVARLGVDTAPFIYFVENAPDLHARCLGFFQAIDTGAIEAFTSTLTLTEALAHPLRAGDGPRAVAFVDLLTQTQGVNTVPPYEPVAYLAADLRARYNLRTPDAIQIATAILTGCDAFLTNDDGLRRVSAEMPVIIMHEIDPNVPVP